MAEPKIVRFYLDRGLKQKAELGEHLFLARFRTVLERAGFRVAYHVSSDREWAKSADRPGKSVYLMRPPANEHGLTIRKNYVYPFWKIEKTAERWAWPVARASFDDRKAPQPEARRFARRIRKKLFGEMADRVTRDGIIYVPLQGRLLEQRSFQTMSPIHMLEHLLHHDRLRTVVATLHPREAYTPEETDALLALVQSNTRLDLVERPTPELLKTCDFVATQNSGVTLSAYFFRKPVVLFGRSDLHHIAANVAELGAEHAIAQAPLLRPSFDEYLWWVLHDQSINAAMPEAEQQIESALRRHGWLT